MITATIKIKTAYGACEVTWYNIKNLEELHKLLFAHIYMTLTREEQKRYMVTMEVKG